MTTETDTKCYRVGTPYHGEGMTLWPVLAPGLEREPIEVYTSENGARFHVDLLGIVGGSGFCYRGEDTEADAARILDLIESDELEPSEVLEQASRILGGFGVEHIDSPGEDPNDCSPEREGLDYVNAGDTYNGTLAYDLDAREFIVTDWGTWLESAEAEHSEESGEERCGNCGEYGDASRRSTCCGGWHSDGSPSGFHACKSCGKCSSCGGEQASAAFEDLDAWEPVEVVDRRGSGFESGPEPFDDLRETSPRQALHGLESIECPECRGNGATSRGKCPTCRGFGDVVAHAGGFIARDGLARFY